MPYYGSQGQYTQFMPFSSLIGGLMAGQQFQRGSLQDAYTREQMEQARTNRQALQEYGQTRDVNALMTKAPEIGMQVQKFVNSLDESKQKRLMNDINIFDAQKGMFIESPEAYAEAYKRVDPQFAKGLIPPDKFAQMDPAQRKQSLFQTEMIAAELKGQLTQAQAIKARQQEQKLKLDEMKTTAYITKTDAQTQLAFAKTMEAKEGKDSKNLPQPYNLFKKINGREPQTEDEYFNFLGKLNDGKADPSKWISQQTAKLVERDPAYQGIADQIDPKTNKPFTEEQVAAKRRAYRNRLQSELLEDFKQLKPGTAGAGKGGGQPKFDFNAEAAQRQAKINAMPLGPQREAAQAALNKIIQGQ